MNSHVRHSDDFSVIAGENASPRGVGRRPLSSLVAGASGTRSISSQSASSSHWGTPRAGHRRRAAPAYPEAASLKSSHPDLVPLVAWPGTCHTAALHFREGRHGLADRGTEDLWVVRRYHGRPQLAARCSRLAAQAGGTSVEEPRTAWTNPRRASNPLTSERALVCYTEDMSSAEHQRWARGKPRMVHVYTVAPPVGPSAEEGAIWIPVDSLDFP
jgi:hypothetical protein